MILMLLEKLSKKEQFKKVLEEIGEVKEEVDADIVDKLKLNLECLDAIESLINLMEFEDEKGFKELNVEWCKKMQEYNKVGRIKIVEYIEV